MIHVGGNNIPNDNPQILSEKLIGMLKIYSRYHARNGFVLQRITPSYRGQLPSITFQVYFY